MTNQLHLIRADSVIIMILMVFCLTTQLFMYLAIVEISAYVFIHKTCCTNILAMFLQYQSISDCSMQVELLHGTGIHT